MPSVLASILPLVFIVVIFWLLIIRPQMKRTKQHRELISNLAVGDEIVSAGGLLGKVTEVGGEEFLVESLLRHAVMTLEVMRGSQSVPETACCRVFLQTLTKLREPLFL